MEQVIREQLLHMLENNSKLTEHEIAIMLGISEEEVQREIAGLEKAHVICGYHTLIDWNKVNDDDVTALAELRVTPQGLSLIHISFAVFTPVKSVNAKTVDSNKIFMCLVIFIHSFYSSYLSIKPNANKFKKCRYKSLRIIRRLLPVGASPS